MTLQWMHTTLLILLNLIMQNACDIWTGCFDSPDSLTSSVVGAVQRKVFKSLRIESSRNTQIFLLRHRCAKCTISFSKHCTSMSIVQNHSSVLMHVHTIVGQLIGRLIIIQKPLKSWVFKSWLQFHFLWLAVNGFTMHVIEWSAILNTKWTIKLWSCRFSNTNHLSI